MSARPTTEAPLVGCLVLPLVLAGCIATSPCTVPEDLALPLATQQQIALPGLDAQLRKCITSVYGESPYRATGHVGWDRYLAGDNSALSNRSKVGALLFFGDERRSVDEDVVGEGVPVVEPALDFERFYQEHFEPQDQRAGSTA